MYAPALHMNFVAVVGFFQAGFSLHSPGTRSVDQNDLVSSHRSGLPNAGIKGVPRHAQFTI